MTIKIVIADDHQLMRQGLLSLFEAKRHMVVVGEASDGRTAVLLVSDLKPDVIIMDIGMPDLNGIDATREIITNAPKTKVIAFSMYNSERMVIEMLRAGASGFVVKQCAFEELAKAVDVVMANKRYLSPIVAGIVIDKAVRVDQDQYCTVYDSLSSREREVLQLVATGKNTKEISLRLRIAQRTVDAHRKKVMTKLSLNSVAELTRYALREGLIQG